MCVGWWFLRSSKGSLNFEDLEGPLQSPSLLLPKLHKSPRVRLDFSGSADACVRSAMGLDWPLSKKTEQPNGRQPVEFHLKM